MTAAAQPELGLGAWVQLGGVALPRDRAEEEAPAKPRSVSQPTVARDLDPTVTHRVDTGRS